MTLAAVLTGDLIKSRASENPPDFLLALKTLLAKLSSHYGGSAEIFRGDGFQLLMRQPKTAFECAVALRAGLIAASPKGERWDARLSLGIAKADTEHPSLSEAAVLSGQGLDSMKKDSFCLFSSASHLLKVAELPTAFVSAIIDNWTAVEARTYYLHLTEKQDQASIAATLGKSRVTVTKALQRAEAQLLDRYLDMVDQWLAEVGCGK